MTIPTKTHGAPSPFAIVGFPCSGMDWVARLLALHPHIAIVDAAAPLGPLGCIGWMANRQRPSGDVAARIHAAVAQKPGDTRVGVVGVEGALADLNDLSDDHIVVVRDGRDVMVHWSLRQLREHGAVLQRFLAEPGDSRMPEVARRFAADPADLFEHHRGLLLCDYDWVRYGADLWADQIDGHFGALGWANDHPGEGRDPRTVRFDEARGRARAVFDDLVTWLGLDPAIVPPFANADPVLAAETDPTRLAEWEVGVWPRWFTPRATKLWKIDGQSGLDGLAGCTADDQWQGDCAPA